MAIFNESYTNQLLDESNGKKYFDKLKDNTAFKDAVIKSIKSAPTIDLDSLPDSDGEDYKIKYKNESAPAKSETEIPESFKKVFKDAVDKKKNSSMTIEDLDSWDEEIKESSNINNKAISKLVKDHVKNHGTMKLKDLEDTDKPITTSTSKEEKEDNELRQKHPDAWGIKHGTYAVTKEPRYHF